MRTAGVRLPMANVWAPSLKTQVVEGEALLKKTLGF